MSDFLFLYGTLLPGQSPEEVATTVSELRRIGPARIRGRLYDLGDYPGAIFDPTSATWVHGQIFEVPDKSVLQAIDRYEEFDDSNLRTSLFVRTRVPARLRDGEDVESWAYLYNRDPGDAPLVTGGSYLQTSAA
jgi:gamma-glutamylcyclotransferase (GGCT)/AIG2-like uncharacterized protein YtfP